MVPLISLQDLLIKNSVLISTFVMFIMHSIMLQEQVEARLKT